MDTVHSATSFTPFEVLYGKKIRLPSNFSDPDKIETYSDYMIDFVQRLDRIHQIAADNLIGAKMKSKGQYDQKTHPMEIKIGDFVCVEKEPRYGKLDQQYVGPFEVVGITEKGNVILETEDGKRLEKHPNKLKSAPRGNDDE
ncbi:uncharacterized protein LOC107043447 [Diachasma alloeum]|uniref:uncharacterized protein LOC107043447 n=1 Tax=Diachasma alloeum TaxID=454923 RepID=UPI0007384F2D|nr:uncharacterized protein LOC107043447 [Diachasma alloeum]